MGLGGQKARGIKVIVWREAEGVSHQVKMEHLFGGELTPQVFYHNYFPISASFGLKRVILYVLHNIPSF